MGGIGKEGCGDREKGCGGDGVRKRGDGERYMEGAAEIGDRVRGEVYGGVLDDRGGE